MRPAFPDPAPRIFKAVASGNDFLVADARTLPGWDPGEEGARALCRRHEGAGADGLIVLGPSRRADASFFLRNRDGSTAAFSGNGARCAALLLSELGAARPDGRVDLELASGRCEARILDPGGPHAAARVEVSIGAPREVRLGIELPEGSPVPRGDHAIVGVPYLALEIADPGALAALDLPRFAPPLRRWSALPHGANVAFHAALPDGSVALRTWERGVEGETQSSGTGCAMVALARALREPGQPSRRIELVPPSGARLAVTVLRESGVVSDLLLEGDARVLAEIVPLAGILLP